MESMKMFKLSERQHSTNSISRGLACDADGIFLRGVAIVLPAVDAAGRRICQTLALDEINRLLSVG
jgi:hypothetical protein